MNSEFVTLKSLTDLITKGATPTINQGYHDTGINFVRAVSIDELGQFESENFLKIDGDTNNKLKRSILHEGDILFSIAGVIGRVAVVEKDILPANTNQALAIIRPKKEKIDPYFLANYLQTPDAKYYFENRIVESAQANLSLTELGKFPIEKISKEEQLKRNILLKNIEKMMIINIKLSKLLKEISTSLFYSWFINYDPMTNKMKGVESTKVDQSVALFFPERMSFSEIGQYPSSWREIRLDEILTETRVKDGGQNAKEFSCTDKGIYPRDQKFSKNLSSDSSKNKIIKRGDIVFGMSRKILNFGLMKEELGGVSGAYNVYEVKSELIKPEYVENFMRLRQDYYYNLILGSGREGQSIDKNYLPKMKFILPNNGIINKFYTTIEPLNRIESKLIQNNKRLIRLKNLIITKMISGELKVN